MRSPLKISLYGLLHSDRERGYYLPDRVRLDGYYVVRGNPQADVPMRLLTAAESDLSATVGNIPGWVKTSYASYELRLKSGTVIEIQKNSLGFYEVYRSVKAGQRFKISIEGSIADALGVAHSMVPPRERPVDSTGLRKEWAPQLWVCKGKVFAVEGGERLSEDEVTLRIQHAALREEKQLKRIQRELQAFQNLSTVADARRERIPDDVRLFVWQRDEGKCVRCGSNERIEFDHIIPVAEGGSSTERNIQLLCEPCNRSKGKST